MSDKSLATQAPTRALSKPLSACTTIGEALATSQFQRAVSDAAPAQMTAQRLMATFRQAARNNPAFDQCNLKSVLGVFMTCTVLGLEPNTPLGHAYMIPFARKRFDKATRQLVDDGYDLQLIIGYQGYLDLAYRNERVQSIAAHAVYEGDDFSFEYGSNEHLQHRPKGLHAEDDLPRYFYMFSKLRGGQAFEVLPTSRVLRIRNGSQGYASALRAKEAAETKGWKVPSSYTEAPWVKHFTAMGQKTALRAGFKWLPKTVEMAAVTRLEDQQDRGMIDFGPVLDGQVNPLDDDLPMLAEPRADPGAAFGTRDGGEPPDDAPPAPPAPPPPGSPAPPAPPKAAPPQPPQPAAPAAQAPAQPAAFAAYLAGDDGEVIDATGEGGYFVDPVAFARAYAMTATASRDRHALAEHNADGLFDAAEVSPEARAILAAIDEPASIAAPPIYTGAVLVPGGAMKPDLRGYLTALRDASAAQTSASIDTWTMLQRANIVTLPAVTKRNAEKIVADRRTELGADKPPPLAAAASPEPPPPTDDNPPGTDSDAPLGGTPEAPAPWSRAARAVVDELDRANAVHDISALGSNAAIKATLNHIEQDDPDEAARLRDYAIARRAELSAQGA